jgi:hypothetical protein
MLPSLLEACIPMRKGVCSQVAVEMHSFSQPMGSPLLEVVMLFALLGYIRFLEKVMQSDDLDFARE